MVGGVREVGAIDEADGEEEEEEEEDDDDDEEEEARSSDLARSCAAAPA